MKPSGLSVSFTGDGGESEQIPVCVYVCEWGGADLSDRGRVYDNRRFR